MILLSVALADDSCGTPSDDPGAVQLAEDIRSRAYSLYKAKKDEEAVALYDEALAVNPLPKIHFQRANSLSNIGRLSESVDAYRCARDLGYSEVKYTHYNQACSLSRLIGEDDDSSSETRNGWKHLALALLHGVPTKTMRRDGDLKALRALPDWEERMARFERYEADPDGFFVGTIGDITLCPGRRYRVASERQGEFGFQHGTWKRDGKRLPLVSAQSCEGTDCTNLTCTDENRERTLSDYDLVATLLGERGGLQADGVPAVCAGAWPPTDMCPQPVKGCGVETTLFFCELGAKGAIETKNSPFGPPGKGQGPAWVAVCSDHDPVRALPHLRLVDEWGRSYTAQHPDAPYGGTLSLKAGGSTFSIQAHSGQNGDGRVYLTAEAGKPVRLSWRDNDTAFAHTHYADCTGTPTTTTLGGLDSLAPR